jgi:hypothetical protein
LAALKNGAVNREQGETIGFVAGRLEIKGDVESPIEDWKYWDPAKNLED